MRCEDMRFPLSSGVFVETEWLGHMLNSCSPLKKLPDSHCGAEAFFVPMPVDCMVTGTRVPVPGPPIKPDEPDEDPRPSGSKARPSGPWQVKQSLSAAPDGLRNRETKSQLFCGLV